MEQVTRELKALRIKKDLTQENMAKLLNISVQTYIAYENNPGKMKWEMLVKLASIFEVDIESFVAIFFKHYTYKM